MSRTFIVGDVHGCRDELDALLDRLAFGVGDRLVFVGDLVARGPDSLGVLDIARQTGAVIVRGNHEQKLLSWRAAELGNVRCGRKYGREARDGVQAHGLRVEPVGRLHAELAPRLRPVDWTLLATSPLYLELPEHGCTVVHAGIVPGVPLAQQSSRTLMYVRCLSPSGVPTDEKGQRLWGRYYEGPEHIVFGHNAMSDVQLHRRATGLDTGCVYGGRLTAMVLHDGDVVPRGQAVRALLVQQPARRVHYDTQRKRKAA
jgi:diadenosine tetraphosphatase ApaH/serine/threonine PP2A family protein phosphatase